MTKEEYKSTYEKLEANGYTPQKTYQQDKIYVAKEGKAQYRLEGITARSVAFAVDGDIIKDNKTKKCDKLLLIRVDNEAEDSDQQEWLQYFIELKGKNIKDALRQIIATIKEPIFQHPSNIKRFARIASSGSIPKNGSDRTVEELKRELIKKYSCDYRPIKSNSSEKFKRPN